MGACASAPRDPPPEGREDAGDPAPSSRANATAVGSSVDPKAGLAVRRDRRESDSRDVFVAAARGAPVRDGVCTKLDDSAKCNLTRVRVSVAKRGGEKKSKSASAWETPREARAWPAWLSTHAGDALRMLDGPRDLASFTRIAQVGQGTYGAVYECADEARNGRRVALKKIKPASLASAEACAFAAREILILLRLRGHAHAVQLLDIAVDFSGATSVGREPKENASSSVFLVLEYDEHDLAGLAACTELGGLRLGQVKRLAWQLFTALEQSHHDGILHRDVKASNLLVDKTGNLKLADWGLAVDGRAENKKGFFRDDRREPRSPRAALTPKVVTLWYRPPELLMGATEYDGRVDVWSAGCVLAELINGETLFPGKTETEQLSMIVSACAPAADVADIAKLARGSRGGPETAAALAALGIASHRDSALAVNPPCVKRTLTEKFAGFPDEALDLLRRLLVLDPARRLTATQALAHPFFFTGPAPEPLSLSHLESSHEFETHRRRNAQRAKAGVPVPRRSVNRLTHGETFDPKALSHVIYLNVHASAELSFASTRPSSRASHVSADEGSEVSFISTSDAAEMATEESSPEAESHSSSLGEGRTRRSDA